MRRLPFLLFGLVCSCAAAGANDGAAGSGGTGGSGGELVDDNPFLQSPTVAAANAVAPGEAGFSGQQRFLWDTWGTEVGGSLPPVSFLLQLLADEPEVFGEQFASFGFVVDPGDDLPVGLKRGRIDATRAAFTCAACHTARLPDGRIWFGAPNTVLDYAAFQLAIDARWQAAGNPGFDAAEVALLQAQGPGRVGAETGSTGYAIPIDFPVKWELSERDHLNTAGSGLNLRTESYLSMFGSGAGQNGVPFPPERDTRDFLAFLGALAPPAPPAPVDAGLVTAGTEVFAGAGCAGCHHLDDPAHNPVVTVDAGGVERFPGVDAAFPRGSIATSPERYELLAPDGGAGGSGGLDEGYTDYITFILDKRLAIELTDGYRASDLRGLWVSAPYLHNGSVATLDDLLRPAAQRPATWMRGTFEIDTAAPSNAAVGHEFGTTLSAADRDALVAFLLSL